MATTQQTPQRGQINSLCNQTTCCYLVLLPSLIAYQHQKQNQKARQRWFAKARALPLFLCWQPLCVGRNNIDDRSRRDVGFAHQPVADFAQRRSLPRRLPLPPCLRVASGKAIKAANICRPGATSDLDGCCTLRRPCLRAVSRLSAAAASVD